MVLFPQGFVMPLPSVTLIRRPAQGLITICSGTVGMPGPVGNRMNVTNDLSKGRPGGYMDGCSSSTRGVLFRGIVGAKGGGGVRRMWDMVFSAFFASSLNGAGTYQMIYGNARYKNWGMTFFKKTHGTRSCSRPFVLFVSCLAKPGAEAHSQSQGRAFRRHDEVGPGLVSNGRNLERGDASPVRHSCESRNPERTRGRRATSRRR